MRKPPDEGAKARGQRLKQAAKSVGYTSATLSERIGVTDGAVRGWWSGLNEPNAEKIKLYAEAVGKPSDYLLYGTTHTDATFENLKGMALAFATLVQAGADPIAAVDALTSPADEEDWTEEEKRILAEAEESMRAWVNGAAEETKLALLTKEQQEEIAEKIVEMVRKNRSKKQP